MQTALDLDEAQIQDLLYLRRLFCGKIGQLGRARKELMSRVPSETIGLCHASDKLEEVTNVAEQLAANGSEEYRVYMQFASSFYRGVSFLGLEGSICLDRQHHGFERQHHGLERQHHGLERQVHGQPATRNSNAVIPRAADCTALQLYLVLMLSQCRRMCRQAVLWHAFSFMPD